MAAHHHPQLSTRPAFGPPSPGPRVALGRWVARELVARAPQRSTIQTIEVSTTDDTASCRSAGRRDQDGIAAGISTVWSFLSALLRCVWLEIPTPQQHRDVSKDHRIWCHALRSHQSFSEVSLPRSAPSNPRHPQFLPARCCRPLTVAAVPAIPYGIGCRWRGRRSRLVRRCGAIWR